MHLLCWDPECAGNDLPAGVVEADACRFCGAPLAPAGQVLAQGAAPLLGGELPSDFNRLMDALKEAGHEVEVVELSAVRVGGSLLVSALRADGHLAAAEVCDGRRAEEVEHAMDLLNPDG